MRIDKIEYHSGKFKYFQIVKESLTEDLHKLTFYKEIPINLIPKKQRLVVRNFAKSK